MVPTGIYLLVLFSRNVSTAFFNGEFQLKLDGRVHVANHQVRVQNLEVGQEGRQIARLEGVFTGDYHLNGFSLSTLNLALKADLLEVEDHLRDIFHHSLNGREFVFNALNAHAGEGEALERVQKNPTKCVANG